MKTMQKLTITLNGTSENPFMKLWGLKHNPFPQVARYEYLERCMQIAKLAGDTIPNTDYIRETLKGFSKEFIDLCCEKFKPGETVKFEVSFEVDE